MSIITALKQFGRCLASGPAIRSGEPLPKELAAIHIIDLLQDNRYGVTPLEEIERRVGQIFERSAIRWALANLERVDLIKSSHAAAPEPGGRRRKMFSLTARSQRAIEANEGR